MISVKEKCNMSNIDMEKLNAEDLRQDLFLKAETVSCYSANGGLLGNPLIATCKHGRLKYELNKYYVESNINASKEMKLKLDEVYELAKHCIAKKDKFSTYGLESLYESITKAKNQALSHGYLHYAEEFAKMLYSEFGVMVEDDLKKIFAGYGKRQILRGVDCSKDAERVMQDIKNKEYGIMPYIHNGNEFDSFKRRYYNNAVVHLSEPVKKWYGVKYVPKAFTMKDYEIALVEQKDLLNSVKGVATM